MLICACATTAKTTPTITATTTERRKIDVGKMRPGLARSNYVNYVHSY